MEGHDYAFFPLTVGAGGPVVWEVAADLFESLGCLEQKKPFTTMALFNHPDGAAVRVEARLVLDPKQGMLLEIQLITGDGALFVLLYRYLHRAVQAYKDGMPQLDLRFSSGELMPPPPRLKPAADPCLDFPELTLAPPLSVYAAWDHEDFEDFISEHPWVTQQVRGGTCRRQTFREHVAQIPESILQAKRLPKILSPCMGACERLALIAAEAEAYFALR